MLKYSFSDVRHYWLLSVVRAPHLSHTNHGLLLSLPALCTVLSSCPLERRVSYVTILRITLVFEIYITSSRSLTLLAAVSQFDIIRGTPSCVVFFSRVRVVLCLPVHGTISRGVCVNCQTCGHESGPMLLV